MGWKKRKQNLREGTSFHKISHYHHIRPFQGMPKMMVKPPLNPFIKNLLAVHPKSFLGNIP
jgi:hypothetical protein